MRYFVLSEHGGIGYLAGLRLLGQDPCDVCTFLVPYGETETWTNDPQLRSYIASKSALIVAGDAKNTDDVQRAWHVAEMGIDSECSGIEAVIISDVPNQLSTLKASNTAEELLAILKCFPSYPYPTFKMAREPFAFPPKSRAFNNSPRLPPLHMPRSPSYSSRPPRLILVLPSRSLKRLHPNARGSKEELAIAWATGKKVNASTTAFATAGSPSTEPGTPVNMDSHSIYSSYSTQLALSKSGSLFPEDPLATSSLSGGWLDPKHALIVRPAVLIRRRCRGDENAESSVPYRIQEEFTIRDRGGGWTISKRDVAHFIVEKALEEWSAWGGRRVRVAY